MYATLLDKQTVHNFFATRWDGTQTHLNVYLESIQRRILGFLGIDYCIEMQSFV